MALRRRRRRPLDARADPAGYPKADRFQADGARADGNGAGREPQSPGKPTFALLDERVPARNPFRWEEALAKLAERYYASHGPAREKDFIWWSGLSARDAKRALEMIKPGLVSESLSGRTFWFRERPAARGRAIAHLLPAYDEYIIGYADRSDVMLSVKHRNAISANGVFRPTIVVDGWVTGLWKRAAQNGSIALALDFFMKPGPETLNSIKERSARLGKFWGAKVELKSV